MKIVNSFKSLTKFELFLWLLSLSVVLLSFLLCPDKDAMTVCASLVGATALIFVSKGDPLGQLLTVLFAVLYSIISYRFRYFGEMVTYLGMTAPIALASVISWIKNPFEKGKNEVKVESLSGKKITLLLMAAALVTVLFYFILRYFNTNSLIISTISVTTSFLASSLTLLRSPYYAIAYSANDIILIILWIIAAVHNIEFLPMIFCFVIFLANDVYGFINWQMMKKRQARSGSAD